MSNQPLVSVVMPVYNSEHYLPTSIKSILDQTYANFEFIILDDGSSDSSAEIVAKEKDSRIIFIKNEINLRTTKTLNKGIKVAKGKYIVRMDSDDWAYPYRIEKQVALMETSPEVVECGGTVEICDENLEVLNVRTYPQTDQQVRSKLFFFNPFAHPATIWRRSALEEVGYYDEQVPLTQDYDLTFRVGKIGKFYNLPDTLLKLRTHAGSSSIARSFEQQKITLQTRYKAITKYGYRVTFLGAIYSFAQLIGMLILPPQFKFWLFNKIRRFL